MVEQERTYWLTLRFKVYVRFIGQSMEVVAVDVLVGYFGGKWKVVTMIEYSFYGCGVCFSEICFELGLMSGFAGAYIKSSMGIRYYLR